MKAVVHKCPNCKANLELKEGSSSGVCDYCRAPYTIDDGVIHVEHTVEITDTTSLKVANTTLYKFKEYDEAEMLFRRLLFKYGHKPEVYIGLILSITYDFTEDVKTIPAMNEINELWERFISIGKEKDINKYKELHQKYNSNFWFKLLNEYTENLKNHKTKVSLKIIEFVYNNYITYCTKDEKTSIQNKYNKFKKNKEIYDKKRKNTFMFSIIFIVASLIIYFLVNYLSLINEKVVFKEENIKISELVKYCDMDGNCSSYDFITNKINDVKSKIYVVDLIIDKDKLNVSFDVRLQNKYKDTVEFKTLNLVDDFGPIITDLNCTYTDTDAINIYDCFTIYDYSDKEIDSKNAKVDLSNADFKVIGEKIIPISINDNDNHVTNDVIKVNVTKSNISLDVKFSNYIEVNKTSQLSYTFSHSVPNKNVSYTFDKNYISFNEDTKIIKAIKVGTSEICVIPEYDVNKKSCKEVRVTALCKDTYTFKFDGSSTSKLVAGNDFCPGKYKIYAEVLNKKNSYHLDLREKNGNYMDSVLIWKSTSLGDEGNKYSFALDSSIGVPSGVTSVKLVKSK